MTAERAARLTALGFFWVPHEEEWEAPFAKLHDYKAEHGNCNVPNRWKEDPKLGSWVGWHRLYKKKFDRGEPNAGITTERVERLTALGFVWDPNEQEWEAQLVRLAAYKAAHGDCTVPWGWTEEPGLYTWVNRQRACKRKLDRGEPSEGMTTQRAA
jgi:hypothetical protein